MSSHYKYLNNNLILIINMHNFPFLRRPDYVHFKEIQFDEVRGHANHEFQQFLLAELAVVNLTGAMAARIGYH